MSRLTTRRLNTKRIIELLKERFEKYGDAALPPYVWEMIKNDLFKIKNEYAEILNR